jgi:hypothetical protein
MSRKAWRCAARGAWRAVADRASQTVVMVACVMIGPAAGADPGFFELEWTRPLGASLVRNPATLTQPDAWKSLVMRARLASSSGDNGERLCRPPPLPSHALSGGGQGGGPFNRRAPEMCSPAGDLKSALAVTVIEPDPAPPTSEVDVYLCGVYWRMPHKIDDAGDFSWKDGAAAERAGRTVCDYAINGMHPDLREALYALGRKADEASISWSILSAFRDDYRQSIASGFKASTCGSWHGGSCRTNGWGDGRAADLWIADANGYPVEDASPLLELIDKLGPALGLARPLPGSDPPHVQLGGDWQEAAAKLREQRLRATAEEADRQEQQASFER